MSKKLCPCCSLKNYADCCARFLNGEAMPTTPEELMRSRYTAYTKANVDYIARTMCPPASIGFDASAAKRWTQSVKWLKLEVLRASMMGNQGCVEFCAHFLQNKKPHVLHEISDFLFADGKWYYCNGIHPGA